MRLYFDVATSRFATDRKTREEPRVVRIVWWRDDTMDAFCRLIRPSAGMRLAPETFPYHKLTLDRLEQDGVDPSGVISELEHAALGCRSLISFNQEYHWRNVHRLMGHPGAPIPTTAVCAMKLAEPILAIPAMRPGGGLKPPNLRECCDRFGVPAPASDDPIEFACQTVLAIRAVFEACVQEIDHK